MTSFDDDLRKLLARELKAEAARFTPAEDGLSRIRGRLRSRPSFPLWGGLRVDAERYGYRLRYVAAEALAWLFSLARRGWQVPSGRFKTTPATRVTAAPDALAASGVSAGVRHFGAGAVSGLRATYQRVGTVGLRLVVAFAAVCLFAGTAFAVPGFRNAIGSIASSSSGGTGPARRRDGRRQRRNGTRPAAAPGRCGRPHWPAGNGKVHGQPVADVDVRESDQDRPQGEPDDAGHSSRLFPRSRRRPRRQPRRASHRPRRRRRQRRPARPTRRRPPPRRRPVPARAARRPRACTSRPGRAPGRLRRRLLQRSRPPPQRPSCGPGRLRRRLGAVTRPAEPGRGDGVAHGRLLG